MQSHVCVGDGLTSLECALCDSEPQIGQKLQSVKPYIRKGYGHDNIRVFHHIMVFIPALSCNTTYQTRTELLP